MYRLIGLTVWTVLMLLLLSIFSPYLQAEKRVLDTTPTASSPANVLLSFGQAQNVATVIELIRAYNAGDLEGVLALLDDKVGWSDCDYQTISVVSLVGKTKVGAWLQMRFADHDLLEVDTIEMASMENQDPTSEDVVGVVFLYRTSDTLKSLGFPKGIKPQLTSKVVFTATHDHVQRFANGPYGGSPEFCRPAAF